MPTVGGPSSASTEVSSKNEVSSKEGCVAISSQGAIIDQHSVSSKGNQRPSNDFCPL